MTEKEQQESPIEAVFASDSDRETTPQEQSFLEKAFPIDQDEQNTAPVRADDGKFAKKSEQQDTRSDVPKGYDKAVKALKLDGWTDDDIKGLSPERLVALGKKAKERHSEIGKKLQSRASEPEEDDESEDEGDGEESDDSEPASKESDKEDEPEADESEDKATDDEDSDSEDEEEQGSAEPARQPLTKERIRSLVKPLSDAIGLGDEVGDELAKVLEQAITPLQNEVAQYRQYHEQIIAQRGEELGMAAREKLAGQFPGLKDEEKFNRVVEKMSDLAKVGQYESMEALMLDAAKLELFDDAKDNATRSALSSKRSQGQPVTSTRSIPAKAMNIEDREDKALEALMSGKGVEAAKRAYRGN
jgi:hypothetical protein